MKKFLKCLMIVGLVIVLFVASFLVSYVVFDAKATFNKQKEAAINFVDENYVEEFEIINSRDVNFNAGFSEFYFYNKENDFYFSVSVTSDSEEGIFEAYGSNYENMFAGSYYSQKIKEKFKDLKFIISTSYDHENKTGNMWIKMLQNGKINEEKEYEFLSYIVDKCNNVNIEYFLVDKKVYNDFKKAPLNHITANAGFEYVSHIDLRYGEEYFAIKDASDFDYKMYLKLKQFDKYLNDDSGSINNPFQ